MCTHVSVCQRERETKCGETHIMKPFMAELWKTSFHFSCPISLLPSLQPLLFSGLDWLAIYFSCWSCLCGCIFRHICILAYFKVNKYLSSPSHSPKPHNFPGWALPQKQVHWHKGNLHQGHRRPNEMMLPGRVRLKRAWRNHTRVN